MTHELDSRAASADELESTKLTLKVAPQPDSTRLTKEKVEAAIAGDESARTLLFRCFAPKLFGLSKRIVGSREVAEDLLQDSFIYAFENFGKLRDPTAVGAWLSRIVVNRSFSFVRREQIRRRIGLTTLVPESEYSSPSLQRFDDGAQLKDAEQVLRKLSAEVRTVWWLKRVEGYTVPEISELTGMSLDRAKKRLARADKKLSRYKTTEAQ